MVGTRNRALALSGVLLAIGVMGQAADAANPPTVPSLATVIEAMPKNLPRAKGPPLDAAIAAARAAVRACHAKGAAVSVLIADSKGGTVVLLSGDGAGVRSQLIAQTKVNIVVKYKEPSGDVAKKAETDSSLNDAAAADPNIGMLRSGGFPITRGGELIGIVGVSGGSLTHGDLTLDDACAKVAVQRLESGN
jgi:uncharacterized protein GlcG (DUF336 family)